MIGMLNNSIMNKHIFSCFYEMDREASDKVASKLYKD